MHIYVHSKAQRHTRKKIKQNIYNTVHVELSGVFFSNDGRELSKAKCPGH